jgi:NDP-sugar pyrophosphorylase family protein
MQIIIPMTGDGQRFRAAGYDSLKPLIKVHGVPMIEWVTRLFPGDQHRLMFVCRKDHLDTIPSLRQELVRIAPQGRILSIDDWSKRGPVADILRVEKDIADDEPVIVSYCDYFMEWDYPAFRQAVARNGYDGAVPCYSGFHPHLLRRQNLYASCRVDSHDLLLEIREKHSWTADPMQSRHSPGIYFFGTGAVMKKYSERLLASGCHIKGEYYVSLVFNHMVKDGMKVWCPVNVPRFCQWGTPQDLEEYNHWVNLVQKHASGSPQ